MTHINAFYMNVDEKKQAVVRAEAELQEAEALLKAHSDYEEPTKAEAEPQDDSKPEAKTKTKTSKK